ncbi:MAG TPA: DUF1697 domain-containing protein [Bryobacteraceae bacterium]|jgi:uncharacterized protein (DUF1697 family)|nr:DUF1697 domain-containing protein [Bryobacteraceae bacterium]
MAKYVAFLRAINVGGHVVKMDELRELFSGLKFSNVETFIASGNVIFETKAAPDEKLEQKIEKHLEKSLGYEVGTFVRSMEEIRAVSVYQPFSAEAVKAAHVVSAGFMRGTLTPSIVEQVMAFRTDVDDFHVLGREAYWLCRVSQTETRVNAKKFERAIGGPVTWRNMNTVVRLVDKYSR